ncbi:hypothetical protein VTH82DRAFT_2671 [Thermothelomyces myriococcoides]
MDEEFRPGTGSNNDKLAGCQSETGPVSSSLVAPPVSGGKTGPSPGRAGRAEVPVTQLGTQPLDEGVQLWKVALGCFALTAPTYGLLSGIGLFQTYWHRIVLAGHSEADVTWIVSPFGFFACFLAAPAGVLLGRYDCGGRRRGQHQLPLGSALYAAVFVGLAWCRSYAAFMACMAVAGAAVGMSVPTTIAFAVAGQWFDKQKGIAMGCVTLGAPLGGIFFTLVLQTLFDKYPWQTAALVLVAAAGTEHYLDREILQIPRSPKFWLINYTLFAYELVFFIQWRPILLHAVVAYVRNRQFYLMMPYNIGAVVDRTVPPGCPIGCLAHSTLPL